MRWEMGFSASEIASTVFSNPKIPTAAPSMDQPAILASSRSHVWEQEPELWRVTFTTVSPIGEGRLRRVFEHWL
jgi:hypothetical protein